jgi:spore coat polysaccharide biosynthesis predicted glycosyltransferase SpsG
MAIRTDESAQIGLGHLVRCISLAQVFKSVYDIKFFCKRISSALEEELHANNFEIHKISKESEFFHNLDSSVITILDGYDFDISYQKKVKKRGARLVCIDDLAEGEFLFQPNVEINCMYIVLCGRVRLYIAQKHRI